MGTDMVLAGDLNGDLGRTGGVAAATVGLQDISTHYLPRRRVCNWYQTLREVVKQGRLMRSLTDYILCSDCQIFQNGAVQDPQHNSGPLHGHVESGYLPPLVINNITYVAGYASLFVCFDFRRGHKRTIFLRSLGALSQSIKNWWASQLVDFWVNVKNCVWFFTCHSCDLTVPFSSIHQRSY